MPTTEPIPASLQMRLLGAWQVSVEGRPLPRLHSRKGQYLLALLVLRCQRPIERAWLAGLLWPESREATALHNLRQGLGDVRRALAGQAYRLRSPTRQTLCLDVTGAEVDVLAFDAAIAQGDPAALASAVSLYRGPLLEGCLEEWVFPERQAREQAYLMALEYLAEREMQNGQPGLAAGYLRRAIAVDPLRESLQRSLMQALAADGDYNAALLAYRGGAVSVS